METESKKGKNWAENKQKLSKKLCKPRKLSQNSAKSEDLDNKAGFASFDNNCWNIKS